MKVTPNRPKPVIQPPPTFTVELNETETQILTVLLGQTSQNDFKRMYRDSDQFAKAKLDSANEINQHIYKMYVAFLNAVK
jgi:hypothetical protein